MAKRWKKGIEENPSKSDNQENESNSSATSQKSTEEEYTPLPAAHIDDDEMNDES